MPPTTSGRLIGNKEGRVVKNDSYLKRNCKFMSNKTYRLVTRSDFDGLVCAMLLKEIGLIHDILFVHPKDMQDGKIAITENDITTNLPYVPNAHLVFDHHLSETVRNQGKRDNHIIIASAPSAARVVYNYYGGKAAFPRVTEEIMLAVDRADSAQYSRIDILHPEKWTLLNYLMDSRTGLGRFKDFRISNYQLMMMLIDCCATLSIEEILELPDVLERRDLYASHRARAEMQIRRCAKVHGTTVVLDLRNEEIIYAANRFLIYAIFPECTLSVHVIWGRQMQNVILAVGKSIVNRTSPLNVGELCLTYGGGGHRAAGTCQVDKDQANETLSELLGLINFNLLATA
jgi:nanoRNase/pAp phosphatase (c-di-AMP/oligoRNAs hydrolase)